MFLFFIFNNFLLIFFLIFKIPGTVRSCIPGSQEALEPPYYTFYDDATDGHSRVTIY